MSIKVKDLVVNRLYYSVLITNDPTIDLVVSTWIYLKKRQNEYGFCEWWEYHLAKDKSKLSLTYYSATANRRNGKFEISSFVQREDLLEALEDDIADLSLESPT